jgi:hypothetical protein
MTAQILEIITLNGAKRNLVSRPEIPFNHPRIIEHNVDTLQLSDEDLLIWSTAYWRCYQGMWEIKEEKFYLTGIKGRYELTGSKPLFADWYSGTLHIPLCEFAPYRQGFLHFYEDVLDINIEKGIVL